MKVNSFAQQPGGLYSSLQKTLTPPRKAKLSANLIYLSLNLKIKRK